ncbi:hypothetical protein [Micromonospora sp. Rc5]|uniref:hypothetical protein n=1 Tax=Micromonospora sp. Rc5 TaxID=1920666 RepID=UPI000BBD43F8|nr:hypothetical protein [Micromonospora sp. Rc5]
MLFPTAAGGSRPPEDPATRRGADRRPLRRGALVAAVALLAALVPPPAPAGAAPSPGAAASGRYYVVGPPVAGQREYLYQIAARTLGSGDRYREIFDLNRDRPQPDGGRLTDPAELRPGWVLELPADARAPGAGQTRYAWYAPERTRPAMRLPVRLGDRQGWALWVDLAGVPDVFTVTGPPGAVSRHARELAEQVHAAGHTVTVVGDLFGADLPDGCVHRPDFPTDEAGLPEGVGVVLSGGLSGPELAFARQVAALTGHRLVPVVVGRALRARWSVTTRDAAAGEVDGSPGRPGGGPVGELFAAGGEP